MPQIVEEKGKMASFDCGCVIDRIGKNFLIKPCSPNCEVYRYVLEQSRKQGNEIIFHIDRSER